MGQTDDNQARADRAAPDAGDLARYRDELDRLREAALELRAAYHEQERVLARTRGRLREATERERALREHPAVRVLLGLARLTRPVRARARGAAGTDTAGAGTAPAGQATPQLAGGREGVGWRPAPEVTIDAPDPPAYRDRLLRRARGEGDRPLEVALIGPAAPLAEQLAGAGWRVHRLAPADAAACPAAADAVVLASPDIDAGALPAQPVRVGLPGGDLDRWLAQPWFDDLDIVLAADADAAREVAARSAKAARVTAGGAARVRQALLDWAAATRVSLAVATPSRDVAEWWGDTHFGRALQRQLERRGHPTRLYLRDSYSSPDLVRADIALHLHGLVVPRPQPAQVNVLWVISHPERVDRRRTEGYDLVLTASEPFAAELTPIAPAPVVPLHQATDPERFRPEPGGPAHDLLFVGNSRRTRRTIVDDLTPTRHDLAVYGGDWTPDLLDPRHLRGEIVHNAELHRHYAAAKIVLNDHWPEMARLGFVSNRIFDALAAGAMVVTDPVEGLERLFDGAVLTYRGREELRGLVDRYLDDAGARRDLAGRGRAAVLERHTFAHRVERIMQLVQPFLDARQRP